MPGGLFAAIFLLFPSKLFYKHTFEVCNPIILLLKTESILESVDYSKCFLLELKIKQYDIMTIIWEAKDWLQYRKDELQQNPITKGLLL